MITRDSWSRDPHISQPIKAGNSREDAFDLIDVVDSMQHRAARVYFPDQGARSSLSIQWGFYSHGSIHYFSFSQT